MTVQPIPDGYPEVIPYIIVPDASGLIDFIGQAFGATTRTLIPAAGGTVGHAELTIGSSVIMVADPDERKIHAPVSIHLYCHDVDAAFQRATALGATAESEPATYFYGDRGACVIDRWGNRWTIATHVEDVSDEELQRRLAAVTG